LKSSIAELDLQWEAAAQALRRNYGAQHLEHAKRPEPTVGPP